jgi:hypothetical protein
MFAYHVYKILTSEVNYNDYTSCTTEIKNTSTNNKLEAILETQKNETLSNILKLMSKIHKMTLLWTKKITL